MAPTIRSFSEPPQYGLITSSPAGRLSLPRDVSVISSSSPGRGLNATAQSSAVFDEIRYGHPLARSTARCPPEREMVGCRFSVEKGMIHDVAPSFRAA